ncbi:unnamed protein product [Chironomus riparius]|uniref:Uncharacterized protein n=1 Tax=Chironomus riparius TaxID=315576 RepID=A0A9N9S3V0_9DIPT|nr:unnamed protein product [Chironomus riparius]
MKTFIILALLVVYAVAYPAPDQEANTQNALPDEPKSDGVEERFGGFGGHHGHHGHHGRYPGGYGGGYQGGYRPGYGGGGYGGGYPGGYGGGGYPGQGGYYG